MTPANGQLQETIECSAQGPTSTRECRTKHRGSLQQDAKECVESQPQRRDARRNTNFSIRNAAAMNIHSLLIVPLLISCAVFPSRYNLEMTSTLPGSQRPESESKYDFDAWLDRHTALPRTAIVVTMSGGGTRAAALAYAALKALQAIKAECPPWVLEDRECSALGNVILVSGISGGSFTATQFVLFGAAGLDERYTANVIKLNTFRSAIGGFVNPIYFGDRTLQIVDVLNEQFQIRGKPATYADLVGLERPFLLLQSTDVLSGRTFPLVQDTLDDLCSDLRKLPLSVAVASAGNLPFALSGVHLENYHETTGCAARSAGFQYTTSSERLLAYAANPINNVLEANLARYRLLLRHALPREATDPLGSVVKISNPRSRRMSYMHLFDGGLADNLGIRHMLRSILTDTSMKKLGEKGVSKLIFLNVNAHSDVINTDYQRRSGPNWIPALLVSSAFGPVEKTSELTYFSEEEALVGYFSQKRAQDTAYPNAYLIKVDPDLLFGTDRLETLREDFKNVPLLTSIDDKVLQSIEEVAAYLIQASPCNAHLTSSPERAVASLCEQYYPGMSPNFKTIPEANDVASPSDK